MGATQSNLWGWEEGHRPPRGSLGLRAGEGLPRCLKLAAQHGPKAPPSGNTGTHPYGKGGVAAPPPPQGSVTAQVGASLLSIQQAPENIMLKEEGLTQGHVMCYMSVGTRDLSHQSISLPRASASRLAKGVGREVSC